MYNRYFYKTEHKFRMSQKQVLEHIVNGDIFGVCEVDIKVPHNLKAYFSEMPPIFKNTIVTENDIGSYMQNFLKDTGKKFQDRKYLVGSMFATKQLFITPLLVWYLKMGLKVTRIYQVVEFKPLKCFAAFADQITTDRRAGDADDNLKIIGETSKLTGMVFSVVVTSYSCTELER